jgi:drug/metabolite transporter (DMT)-like permease
MSNTLSNPSSRVLVAYLLLTLASVFWAGNSTIVRAMRDDVSPVTLSFWRWFLAVAVLLPFVWTEIRREWPAIRRSAKTIIWCALLGTSLQSALTFWSLQYTVALHVQIFNSIIPLAVMGAVWLLDGARPTRKELGGFLISGFGVIVIICHGDLMRVVRLDFNLGDIGALSSMLIWGVYAALVKRCPQELSPYGLAFITGLVGVLMIAPLHLVEIVRDPGILNFSPQVIMVIAYTGLLTSLLATVFLNIGVQRVGPSRAAIFTHLVPVFGACLSVGLLGEEFGWHHAAGFALVLVGVAVCNRIPLR